MSFLCPIQALFPVLSIKMGREAAIQQAIKHAERLLGHAVETECIMSSKSKDGDSWCIVLCLRDPEPHEPVELLYSIQE